MRVAWVFVIAGCGAAAPAPAPTIANRAEPGQGGLLVVSEDGFGPLHAESQATLSALRAAFAGYEVRPQNDTGLTYGVYLNGEKLAWVIPNEDDGTLFNVHATSPRVEIRGHDWRVGRTLDGAASLTECECWGDNPTCYRRGEHVAVNLARGCDGLVGSEQRALRVLDGTTIQRVIWSPKPFRGDGDGREDVP